MKFFGCLMIVRFLVRMFVFGHLNVVAFPCSRQRVVRGKKLFFTSSSSSLSSASCAYAATPSQLSATTTNTTRYTIDTPPIDRELLQSTVFKSLANFDKYLTSRPVAHHTQEAFEQFQAELAQISPTASTPPRLILDSGCGTGRSSLFLGDMYPDRVIVGVDRSIHRLGRVARDLPKEDDKDQDRQHVQRVRDNVLLVRAELVHFWRLWCQNDLVAEQHFLLYPNPYPKQSRLKQRWYAHPSFPLLLQISGGNPLILRSNWRGYLQELADAVVYISEYDEKAVTSASAHALQVAKAYLASAQLGPQLRIPGQAWTNFEAKYDKIGETTYQLCLRGSDPQTIGI